MTAQTRHTLAVAASTAVAIIALAPAALTQVDFSGSYGVALASSLTEAQIDLRSVSLTPNGFVRQG